MSCSLGAVALPDQLFWSDEFADAEMATATRRTVGGASRYWQRSRSGGRLITLEVVRPWCWITLETVEALYALARAGGTHLLTLDSHQFWIRFRDPPLDIQPLSLSRETGETLSSAPRWSGKILLEEVI